ncbi:flippase-like domain-containing protein [Candidatus Saccharibacteria bacterium]|nr:flippase-like domain-containing protein [Candidatus Saccharibacteria bacterium]
MSVRKWLSLATIVLLVVVLYFARHEIVKAWELLSKVNVWILLLLFPLQLLAYYAAAETLFVYLRSKQTMTTASPRILMRMALEMNFVNHVLPSGGVSGLSYMGWRLGMYGVNPGRATAAQAVRYTAGFIASIVVIAFSVLAVTIDGNINRWIILVSAGLVMAMIVGTVGIQYLVSSKKRIDRFSDAVSRAVNRLVWRLTRGKKRVVLHEEKLRDFFGEMHKDYLELRRDWRLLLKPLGWALLFTLTEGALFYTTFAALGDFVNPAPILIAYILASIAGFIVVTPGGAGAYEAIMVTFLALAGISSETAIAGILLTRIIVLLTTIGLGYFFYQHALLRYGKDPAAPTS